MSKIYTCDGEILPIDDNHNGLPKFIKEFGFGVENHYLSNSEKSIVEILYNKLHKDPHPHIVEIYKVNQLNYEMELLETPFVIDTTNAETLIRQMKVAKEALNKMHIYYIDWKHDNIGWNGSCYKIFDFDSSGIIDEIDNTKWKACPPKLFNYKKAIRHGMETPREIEDFCFDQFCDEIHEMAETKSG